MNTAPINKSHGGNPRATGPAFLGAVALGDRIEFMIQSYDRATGTVSESTESGVVTHFERIPAVPHNFVRFAIDNGPTRDSRPDRHVTILDLA